MKKTCVSHRTASLLKLHAAAVKKGVPVDMAAVAKCADEFDGGAKGFAKGSLGTLQAKQDVDEPKTLCTVIDDGTALASPDDAFAERTLGAVLNPELD